MSAIDSIRKSFRRYEGVQALEVEGEVISYDGSRQISVVVTVPCHKGKAFSITLAEGDSTCLALTDNRTGELDEDIVRDIASAYGLEPVLKRRGL
jgi:hypothetical protein